MNTHTQTYTLTRTHIHIIKMTDVQWLSQNYILKMYALMKQRLNFPQSGMGLIINREGEK